MPGSATKTVQPGQRLPAHLTATCGVPLLLNAILVFLFKLFASPLRPFAADRQLLSRNRVILFIAIDRVITHSLSPSGSTPFSTVFCHDHTVVKY
jgi:hypothetical protein